MEFVQLHYHGKEHKAWGDLHEHDGDQSMPQALYEGPRTLLVAGVHSGIGAPGEVWRFSY